MTTLYTRTPGGRLVSELLPGGVRYYYLTDGLGSIVALVDVNGNVAARYGYDPYGQTVVKTGSAAESNPFRYTGAYLDSTGLYKMGARYYDPARGRFTQLDPLGNGYVYASDNPVNFVDPTGLDDCSDANSSCSAGPINPYEPADYAGPNSSPRNIVTVTPKIAEQMADRGWTGDDINNVANNPVDQHPAINKTSNDPATAYYGSDGHYIVVNDNTGEVIQISNRNKPDWWDNTQDPNGVPIRPR
ncbi:MAG: colicin E5-related ribonuclease [Thermomicrobiales bacterium]